MAQCSASLPNPMISSFEKIKYTVQSVQFKQYSSISAVQSVWNNLLVKRTTYVTLTGYGDTACLKTDKLALQRNRVLPINRTTTNNRDKIGSSCSSHASTIVTQRRFKSQDSTLPQKPKATLSAVVAAVVALCSHVQQCTLTFGRWSVVLLPG